MMPRPSAKVSAQWKREAILHRTKELIKEEGISYANALVKATKEDAAVSRDITLHVEANFQALAEKNGITKTPYGNAVRVSVNELLGDDPKIEKRTKELYKKMGGRP